MGCLISMSLFEEHLYPQENICKLLVLVLKGNLDLMTKQRSKIINRLVVICPVCSRCWWKQWSMLWCCQSLSCDPYGSPTVYMASFYP